MADQPQRQQHGCGRDGQTANKPELVVPCDDRGLDPWQGGDAQRIGQQPDKSAERGEPTNC